MRRIVGRISDEGEIRKEGMLQVLRKSPAYGFLCSFTIECKKIQVRFRDI